MHHSAKAILLRFLFIILPFYCEAASDINTKIRFGGFIKLDALSSKYSNKRPVDDTTNPAIIRNLVLPWAIDTTTGSSSKGSSLDYHAKHSRFTMDTDTNFGEQIISTHLETDFMAGDQGNELNTNSYAMRIRRAFVTYKFNKSEFVAGQDWSTFETVQALPESNDFGKTVGSVFVRQALLRWTWICHSGKFHLGLENNETRVFNASATGTNSTNETFPDIILKYEYQGDLGLITMAAMARNLKFENGVDSNATGYFEDDKWAGAYNISGKINAYHNDDLRFMLTHGAIGRYIGLGAIEGASIVNENNKLTVLKQTAAFLAYRHFWTDHWRSTIAYAFARTKKDSNMVTGTPLKYKSYHASLMYAPVEPYRVGIEYIFAERKNIDGSKGDLNRYQFTVKYDFQSSWI